MSNTKINSCLASITALMFFVGCQKHEQRHFNYPVIENIQKTESHFGIGYIDEYHNLENIKDSSVLNWYRAQDKISEAYFLKDEKFNSLYQHYDSLENREVDPARKISYSEAGPIFYLSSNEGEESEYMFRKSTYNSEAEKLFDPKTYSDGSYDIEYIKPSYDGNFVALALGKPENFFNHIIVLDCKTLNIIGTPIKNAKPQKAGGIIWSPDGKSILFIAYPNNGTAQNDRDSYTAMYSIDKLEQPPKPIFKNGLSGIVLNEEYYPVPKFRSVHSNYLLIYLGNAADHWDCYYLPTEDFLAGIFNWKKLFSENDMVLYDYGVERDHTYYFKRVNEGNIEFCSVDLKNPDFANPKILATGNGPEQINSFKILKDHIYYTLSSNGISESLYEYFDGKEPLEIKLPFAAGSISFDYRSPYKNDLWVTLSGWTSNPKEYYLKEDGAFEFTELGMWPDYPEFKNIISEVIEVSSYDGTKVPLSIIRRKDHKFGSGAKGIITAYGAYGMSESPWHHSPIMDFVNKGNIYATAHVRGGGEKGPAWHDAGLKSTKQNSWKDLIACSEYLIDKGYVNSKKLGLNVNSAGAITGGMAINERPELFSAFSAFVPQINVIRIEYLDSYDDSDTAFEFGTVTELESYQDLLKMDPVVNLQGEKKYPSTLLTIGFNDYLIPPSGAGKYIALLQSFNPTNDRPYLLDIKFDAEHEIDWLDDYARMLFFMESELD